MPEGLKRPERSVATTKKKNPILMSPAIVEEEDGPTTAMTTAMAPGSPEPTFADLTTELATAERESKGLSEDAKAAKAKRSTTAVQTIKAAYSEKVDHNDVRTDLLAAGVLKGTVSKIITILVALDSGVLYVKDVQSLNGAYTAVKTLTGTGAAAVAATTTGKAAKVSAATPDEAIKLIVDYLRSITDEPARFAEAGELMTKFTNAITDAMKEEDEEGEGS